MMSFKTGRVKDETIALEKKLEPYDHSAFVFKRLPISSQAQITR